MKKPEQGGRFVPVHGPDKRGLPGMACRLLIFPAVTAVLGSAAPLSLAHAAPAGGMRLLAVGLAVVGLTVPTLLYLALWGALRESTSGDEPLEDTTVEEQTTT
jgi:hypothetical protein